MALVALVGVLLSTFGLAVGPAAAVVASPRNIAVFASDDAPYIADVHDKLAASGAFGQVTTLPESGCSTGTPSLAELEQYDAVYVWSDCSFADPTTLGNVLADYVDAGGTVVVSMFALWPAEDFGLGGRLADEGYLPTTAAESDSTTEETLVADLPDSPLLAGVTSFDGGLSSYHATGMTVTDGSTLVAHWTDGEPLVAYRGNVVELNFYPPSDSARFDFWTSSTDGTQLMVNALNLGAGPSQVAPAFTSDASTSFATDVSDSSFTVTTSGTPTAAITESGDLPSDVTFVDNGDGTATLSGTPAAGTAGSYPITLTATNGVDPDATQDFTLDVDEAPAITSDDTAGFTVGSDGSFSVTTTAGYPAATTLTEDGALPDGVSFTDNGDGTATISGTPANGTAADYPITVTATNNAESSTQSFTLTVSLAAQDVSITSTPPSPAAVVGQTYAVTTAGGGSDNPVDVAIDASSAGVCRLDGATVTFQHPGSCVVDADQAGDDEYADGSATQTIPVTQAATRTRLTVRPNALSAAVAPSAPGAGAPAGTVTFSVDGAEVGSAQLRHGIATLAHQVAAGKTRSVAAVYSGNDDFSGSSASTARRDPAIIATVSGASARSHGWYRTPVTVTFHCTTDGAALTGTCPAKVTLKHNGAGQSVTRTIRATDGGADTVTVRGINIDRQAPRVAVTGVTNRATYPGQAPEARCTGSDALSGVSRCTVIRHVAGEAVTVTATAIDKAGNVRTATVHYTVPRFYIAGVAYRNGAYQVREGQTYSVVALVKSTTRPQYYNAAPAGQAPTASPSYLQHAGKQSGLRRYVLLVRIDRGLGRYRFWNMGVRAGGTVHRIVFQPGS